MALTTLQKLGGGAGAILAIASAAALIGFKADRPAWSSDLVVIRSEFTEGIKLAQATAEDAQRLSVSQALESTQLQLYRNADKQNTHKAQGEAIPEDLIKERLVLERRARRFQSKLDKLDGLQ